MMKNYSQKWLVALMTVSFIITILYSGISSAQEPAKKAEAQETQKGGIQIPEERKYLVKEGDTLWDISSSVMKDPFLWPRLWKDNKYIINPDLIYPGNIIILPGEEIVIKEEAAPVTAPKEETPAKKEEGAPLAVVEETAPQAEEIAAAPSQPQAERREAKPYLLEGIGVLTDEVLLFSSGFVVSRLEDKGVVVGSWDKKVILSDNDTIYINRKNNPAIANGEKYTVYKVIRQVKHPITEKKMGHLVKILGIVQITDVKKDVATGTIIRSFDVIGYGDKLMPYKKTVVTDELLKEKASARKLMGYIVEVKDEKIQNAQLDVVYIDKGTKDGVTIGNRFVVVRPGIKTSRYSPGEGMKLPGQIVGELKVISVNEGTATALVLNSVRTISKGDIVETK
ncbi:MAG: LysM peptidoglycan-binding domain-containing protein [Nitrospirae bacterium]|nr:LysM peptidoglycan-binding domain-containing protein [Nitrospirota bacterium]